MPFSSDNETSPRDQTQAHEGACAAWGLIIGAIVGAIPAFIVGGRRMFVLAALIAASGWIIGALLDRSRR